MAKSCNKCGKELKLDWLVCPYCGHVIIDHITMDLKRDPEKGLIYPISLSALIRNKDFEYLILLMLKMNKIMTWSDLSNRWVV